MFLLTDLLIDKNRMFFIPCKSNVNFVNDKRLFVSLATVSVTFKCQNEMHWLHIFSSTNKSYIK